ncbi:MAG: NAD-dependent epimerase/dehydratase family protein [Pseudomonadota bacterium]
MSNLERRRALVTGLSGFTGPYVRAELERAGYAVTGPSDDRGRAVNLLDAEALAHAVAAARPDVVVHLAAISFVAHGDVEAIYRVNIVGTRNLLAALATCPHAPRSVLLASSANIYGNAAAAVTDEDTPDAPTNDYAVSKLAMEHMARLWSDRLPIVIARPFNYSGVGQGEHFLLPKIVAHFRRRAPVIELGNLDVARDFSDVRVVARCYARLIESGRAGTVYNVCSGRAHSLMDVLAMMEQISGYMPEIRVNPAFVRANEVKRLQGARRRLEDAIGPVEDMPLMDTLRWMYEADA